MFVVLGGGNFFLFVVEELDRQVFAKAVCVDAERFKALVFFALVDAVGEFPIGPVEVPAFSFEVLVLIGWQAAKNAQSAARERCLIFIFILCMGEILSVHFGVFDYWKADAVFYLFKFKCANDGDGCTLGWKFAWVFAGLG